MKAKCNSKATLSAVKQTSTIGHNRALPRYSNWVGDCLAIKETRNRIDQVSQTVFPVLIVGQPGTGKRIAARRIHQQTGAEGEMIELSCLALRPEALINAVKQQFSRDKISSIFLTDVFNLPNWAFEQIKSFCNLHHHTNQKNIDHSDKTRLIISVLGQENEYDPNILSWLKFHLFTIELPTLWQRRSDFSDILSYLCDQYGQLTKKSFTPNTFQKLSDYPWSGNFEQLESVIAKLSVLVQSHCIDDEMVKYYFPELFSSKPSKSHCSPATTDQSASTADTLFQSVVGEDHPALIRAIGYIQKHYKQQFSLKELSSAAFISPSHLSFLLKQRFNRSFKKILTEIRIQKAKDILETLPARHITRVCQDVGFVDLSHFEKTFKKVVGISPSQYRNSFRKPLGQSLESINGNHGN